MTKVMTINLKYDIWSALDDWTVSGRSFKLREFQSPGKPHFRGLLDYMIALVTFLHGLRVSELIDLRWDDIDYRKGTIAIRRLKGSIDGTHYLERDEAIGLKRLQCEQ
jgi:integrase